MKYAVIKTGGKQYRVSEGDIIEVDRLEEEKDGKKVFEEVLLVSSDAGLKIGKPFIAGEKVEGKIIDHTKGEKLYISKYKAKVRYRRRTGFRASLTKVLIEKIGDKKEIKEEKIEKSKKTTLPKVKSTKKSK